MTTETVDMTDAMLEVLELAVNGESLYSGCVGGQIYGIRSLTIDRLIAAGCLVRRPHGYVRVTDAGHAAYRQYA